MFWRLLPHASACIAGGGVFLLDVRQDRYFRIPPAALSEMTDWLDCRHGRTPPPAIVQLLRRAGVYREGDQPPSNVLRNRVAIPQRPVCRPDATGNALPAMVRQVVMTSLRLRFSSLGAILAGIRLHARPPAPSDTKPALEAAAEFDRARIFVPIARDCLLDSLALEAALASREIGYQLIFGIAPRPFMAHCWLQTRDAILNDSYDHVSHFTPILAL